jgi:heme exporter protein A
MPIEIIFKDIKKTYGEKSLYQNLSGCIEAGRCTCITGNNGSGKSTFLKIIAGLIHPTSGTFTYREAGKHCSLEQIREQTAFVSPEIQLYNALSAFENLHFFSSMSFSSPLKKEELRNLLQKAGLANEADKPLGSFSTGMKQRLKLALLPASKRKLWLLDEPSSNLDDAGRRIVDSLIEQARREQRTVLLATNVPTEVAYADTIFRLS